MADIDFGQISEALNDKADRDINNLNTQGRVRACGLSFPSNKFIDLTIGASGTDYTAPANGFFCVRVPFTGNQACKLINTTQELGNQCTANGSWTGYTYIQAQQGDVVQLCYNRTPDLLRFVYANGSDN